MNGVSGDCPECGDDLGAGAYFEHPDRSVGWEGGWEGCATCIAFCQGEIKSAEMDHAADLYEDRRESC